MTNLTTTHHCVVHSDLFGDYETTCNPSHVEWWDGEAGILVAYPERDHLFSIVDPDIVTVGKKIEPACNHGDDCPCGGRATFNVHASHGIVRSQA